MFRSIRLSLFALGLAGAIAAIAVLIHALWSFDSLGRSAASAMESKQVLEDALPPPLYLVEMRLALSEAVEGTLTPAQAREVVDEMARRFDERRRQWATQAVAPLRELVAGPVNETAQRMTDIARHEVLDRLDAGDRDGARAGLALVQTAYLDHRAAIDELVRRGNLAVDSAVSEFEGTRRNGLIWMPLYTLLFFAAAGWIYWRSTRAILEPVQACVELADRIAAGDLSEASPPTRRDELGRLQGALQHMTSRLAAMRSALIGARDAAEVAGQAKAEFLANMSHEIRTPMNAILGLTQVVQRSTLTERQREHIDRIGQSGRYLLHIIDDILDFSKIEAGKLSLEDRPYEIDRVLEQAAQSVDSLIGEKPIELIVDRHEDVPAILRGDAMRLKQVLINLASNAVKFTAQGEIELRAAGGAGQLRLTVRDTGIGMTPLQVQGLFQAFSQADTSTARQFGGTGLGLAISRRLAIMMGGDIEVQSQPGVGSTFTLALPLRAETAERAAELVAARERAEEARPLLTDVRVLVVDDNDSARRALSSTLRSFGMEVVEAAGGREGITLGAEAKAAGRPFAIVLVDWRMPEIDGFSVIDQLIDGTPGAKTSFIMVSAFDRDMVERAMPGHALDGLLQKPVTPSALLNTLYEVLSEKRRASQRQRQDALPASELPQLRGVVLLVEDNELNQLVGTELLGMFGLQVTIAAGGHEALTLLRSGRRFDAVFMDVQMPGIDGLATTRLIREHAEFSSLPIIAMTANALNNEKERCLAAGMSDYLTKPVELEQLSACLQRWLTPYMNGAPPAASHRSP
jgi:signal transduction histidine kinase/DNA-binding response OmpR family regulator